MTQAELDAYYRGEYDPRYPHDPGLFCAVVTLAVRRLFDLIDFLQHRH